MQIVEQSHRSLLGRLLLETAPSRFLSATSCWGSVFLTRKSNDFCNLKLRVSQAATGKLAAHSSTADRKPVAEGKALNAEYNSSIIAYETWAGG